MKEWYEEYASRTDNVKALYTSNIFSYRIADHKNYLLETYKFGLIVAIASQERSIMEYGSKLYHLPKLYQLLCCQEYCLMLKCNIQVVKYPVDIHPGNKRKSTMESNLHQGNI